MKDDLKRKPSVIHTRIPESLDQAIKRRAGTLGLSVSNLVRNVLLNTFGLVEGVIADSASVARAGAAVAAPLGPPPPVLAWQEVTLNLNALCERCNTILPKGTRAAIAVTAGPGPRPFRCVDCVEHA